MSWSKKLFPALKCGSKPYLLHDQHNNIYKKASDLQYELLRGSDAFSNSNLNDVGSYSWKVLDCVVINNFDAMLAFYQLVKDAGASIATVTNLVIGDSFDVSSRDRERWKDILKIFCLEHIYLVFSQSKTFLKCIQDLISTAELEVFCLNLHVFFEEECAEAIVDFVTSLMVEDKVVEVTILSSTDLNVYSKNFFASLAEHLAEVDINGNAINLKSHANVKALSLNHQFDISKVTLNLMLDELQDVSFAGRMLGAYQCLGDELLANISKGSSSPKVFCLASRVLPLSCPQSTFLFDLTLYLDARRCTLYNIDKQLIVLYQNLRAEQVSRVRICISFALRFKEDILKTLWVFSWFMQRCYHRWQCNGDISFYRGNRSTSLWGPLFSDISFTKLALRLVAYSHHSVQRNLLEYFPREHVTISEGILDPKYFNDISSSLKPSPYEAIIDAAE